MNSVKDKSFTHRFVSARCLTQSLLCVKGSAEMRNIMSDKNPKKAPKSKHATEKVNQNLHSMAKEGESGNSSKNKKKYD